MVNLLLPSEGRKLLPSFFEAVLLRQETVNETKGTWKIKKHLSIYIYIPGSNRDGFLANP